MQGRQKEFFQGRPLLDFSKRFYTGGQKWWNLSFALEIKKTALFIELFKFLPLFQHPYACVLCVGKVRATPLKDLGNFKRFKTIPNSEILLNLLRKMKYLTDQFQLCYVFFIGNTK